MDHMDGSVGSGADAATGGCTNQRRRRTDAACLPLEILTTEILARLPVKSLLRFRSVCKAWRTVISGDLSLVSAHLQHHQPEPSALLIFPLLLCKRPDDDHCRNAAETLEKRSCSAMAFYRWDAPLATTTISLVHAVDDMPPERRCRRVYHDSLAYCDGLVLVATDEGTVHLFNPSARQAATLPSSPGGVPPSGFPWHQAFGLGRDPRSGAYKAARYFNRATDEWTAGMEVFTVGVDRLWRELAAAPAHCVTPGRTATAFKGSLVWPVNEEDSYRNGAATSGFLRLSLDDETFGITPPPPGHLRLVHDNYALSELRGELCLVRQVEPGSVVEMWMTDDSVRPRWERRYAIRDALRPWPSHQPLPVAVLDDGIVFHDKGEHHYDGYAAVYSFQTREYKEMVRMSGL